MVIIMDLEEWNIAVGKIRVRAVFQSLLILLGVLFVQFVASLLCLLGWYGYRSLAGAVRGGTSLSENQMALLENSTEFSMAVSLLYACIVIVWCGVLYRRWQWRSKPDYKTAFGGKRLPGILALGFGSCIVMTLLLSLISTAFPGLFENYNRLMEKLDISSSVWTLPYVVLLGPVAEELIFRGVITDRLKPAFSFWTVNVIQAALFGVFHLNVIQGLYAFCLGLILGLVVKVTDTISASIMTHIFFNGTTEILSLIPSAWFQKNAWAGVTVVIAAFFAFLWGLHYYCCALCAAPDQSPEKP
jgi:hypothetical protein